MKKQPYHTRLLHKVGLFTKQDVVKHLSFYKKQPIQQIELNVKRAEQVRKYVAELPCPKCSEKQLTLTAYTQGKKGWESQIICGKCRATSIINNTGINMNLSGVPSK